MAEPAKAPAPAAPVAAANPNKMMFIMMGAMFFLLIAGMGGMFFALKGKSSDHAAAATASEPAKDDAKSAAKPEIKEKEPAKYVSFDPPFVVNFKDGAVKFLQVSIQVMTRDSTMERELKDNDPAIRNSILALLDGQTYDVVSTTAGKEKLRQDALQKIRDVMKDEGGDPTKVEAVYFTAFVMQ